MTQCNPERGNSLVEFVVTFLMLFAVFSGVFEFGYVIYGYNTLVNAVRSGARYASLKPYDSSSSTPSAAFNTSVQDLVVYGDPNPPAGASPILNGLAPSNVSLTVGTSGAAPIQMTVAITNYSIGAVFGVFTLNGKPSVTFPYLGIPTPP